MSSKVQELFRLAVEQATCRHKRSKSHRSRRIQLIGTSAKFARMVTFERLDLPAAMNTSQDAVKSISISPRPDRLERVDEISEDFASISISE
jgi:cell division septation protein DedD